MWEDLVRIEPRLGEMLKEIQSIKDDGTAPSFCANAQWYRSPGEGEDSFKDRLVAMAGWHAQSSDPEIRSDLAYNVAYEKLYEALPNCRNCGCF